jgi:hypothetical protein
MFVYSVFRKEKKYVLSIISAVLLLFVSYHTLILLLISWGLMLLYTKTTKWFFVGLSSGLAAIILVSTFTKINPMSPIVSRYNLQNKIGKGGYYLESINKGNIVYFQHDEFETLKTTIKSKKENNLLFFELTDEIQVFDYKDGANSYVKRALKIDEGWYYQKLHYVPAKSYVLHKMLAPEFLPFVSHFVSAVEYTMTIPYYKVGISTLPFYLESIILYSVGLLFFLLNIRRLKSYCSSINLFLVLFSFFSIVLIGYSTPIVGNIIRHKAVIMPFLIVLIIRIGFDKKQLK